MNFTNFGHEEIQIRIVAQNPDGNRVGNRCGLFLPLLGSENIRNLQQSVQQFSAVSHTLDHIGLVTPAIADIGRGAGKLLLITTLIAYADTVFAGLLSYGTSVSIFPGLIRGGGELESISEIENIAPYFTIDIPPMMDVMTSLVFAFMLGLGMAFFGPGTLKRLSDEFKDIVVKTIEVVIVPLLPVYIFGIFLGMTHTGQVFHVLKVFISIIGIIFILHLFRLVFQYCLAGLVTRRNPFRLLGTMMPAYFTALGTSSSAATIPVTLAQTLKNGVSEEIAGFTIPLCATIHLAGSMLKITACSVALMLMQGMPFDFGMFRLHPDVGGHHGGGAGSLAGHLAALGILSSMLDSESRN